jgi:hypothetical protein
MVLGGFHIQKRAIRVARHSQAAAAPTDNMEMAASHQNCFTRH